MRTMTMQELNFLLKRIERSYNVLAERVNFSVKYLYPSIDCRTMECFAVSVGLWLSSEPRVLDYRDEVSFDSLFEYACHELNV